MASRSFNSFSIFSLAILGAVLLSQGLSAEARGKVGVNPFCQKAIYFQLCNRMVGDAKTPKDASINAIKSTRALAAQIPALTKSVSEVVQGGALDAKSKEDVIKQCTEIFETATDDLDLALGAVEQDDTFTAATKLSAINFAECTDALEEFGMTLPMDKVVTHFERSVSNSLAVVQAQ